MNSKKKSVPKFLAVLPSQDIFNQWHKELTDECYALRDHLFFLSENSRYRGVFETINKTFSRFNDSIAVYEYNKLDTFPSFDLWVGILNDFENSYCQFSSVERLLTDMRSKSSESEKSKTNDDYIMILVIRKMFQSISEKTRITPFMFK